MVGDVLKRAEDILVEQYRLMQQLPREARKRIRDRAQHKLRKEQFYKINGELPVYYKPLLQFVAEYLHERGVIDANTVHALVSFATSFIVAKTLQEIKEQTGADIEIPPPYRTPFNTHINIQKPPKTARDASRSLPHDHETQEHSQDNRRRLQSISRKASQDNAQP